MALRFTLTPLSTPLLTRTLARRWGHAHAAGPAYTIAYETGLAGPSNATASQLSEAARAKPEFFFDVEDSMTSVERAKAYALKNAKVEAHAGGMKCCTCLVLSR